MASILGLDLARNTSFFAPRDFKQNIAGKSSLSDERKRHFLRAKCASENGYETLGLFAAAVTAANFAGVRSRTLNTLTWGYIASRVAYNVVYVRFGDVPGLHHLRSLIWSSSVIMSCTLFVMAGLNMNNLPAVL
ncbi:hypothetical protein K4F52_008120 [Lecanicillium sp. MT-2017a]|nr:hypothetical protein K4F52_008120 [Lecanicillium sp. MT-2017a]